MNTYNEKEIIALLQDPARQKEAFECIVNEYSEQLYWQIRRMVLSHEDANDLLQNTFIKAWTNLEYFRAEAKMSTWLYRIALNECLTFLNKQRATNQLSIDDADADMVNKLESDTYFNGDGGYISSFQERGDEVFYPFYLFLFCGKQGDCRFLSMTLYSFQFLVLGNALGTLCDFIRGAITFTKLHHFRAD